MPGKIPPPLPVGTTSILHAMVQLEQKTNYYSTTLWELSIWEYQPGVFVLQNHQGIKNNWGSASLASEKWIDPRSFTSLREARSQLDQLVRSLQNPPQPPPNRNQRYQRQAPPSAQVTYSYFRPETLSNLAYIEQLLNEQVPLPEGLARTELVRLFWGHPQPLARQFVLRFAGIVGLNNGYWWAWKWLFKQSEVTKDYPVLQIMLPKLDTMPRVTASKEFFWLRRPPSKDTVTYMKLRARRLLRRVELENPEAFVRLAFNVLFQAGKGRTELDPAEQWLSFDLLYRQANRYIQPGHSRGKYRVRTSHLPPGLATVRAGQNWLAHPELLQKLYAEKEMAYQVTEWAVHMLRLAGQPIPQITEERAEKFLQSGSIMLRYMALQQLGQNWPESASLAALQFFMTRGSRRRAMAVTYPGQNRSAEWRATFAATLTNLVFNFYEKGPHKLRSVDSLILLSQNLLAEIPTENILVLLPGLVVVSNPSAQEAARRLLGKVELNASQVWVMFVQANYRLSEEQKKVYGDFLVQSLAGREWDSNMYPQMEIPPWTIETLWRLMVVGKWDTPELNNWLNSVFSQYTEPQYLANLLKLPAVLALLARIPAQFSRVMQLAQQRHVATALSAATFRSLAGDFSPEAILSLIEVLDDSSWAEMANVLPSTMRETGKLAGFWSAVWNSGVTGHQLDRILNALALRQSFLEVANRDFIRTDQVGFSDLLEEWLYRRPDDFLANSENLLFAATGKIPNFRWAALRRVEKLGMNMPFALRLTESGLPPAMALGRRFFENLPAGDEHELEFALALCDSPDQPTQFFGREFVRNRWERLAHTPIVGRLAEHSDPPVQEEVAQRLLEQPQALPDFDRPVLRARNKGRRAKELVKKRLGQLETEDLDPAVLLEMAHGRTPRDSEWAWQQLARLARSGKTIEGLQIGEVEGI